MNNKIFSNIKSTEIFIKNKNKRKMNSIPSNDYKSLVIYNYTNQSTSYFIKWPLILLESYNLTNEMYDFIFSTLLENSCLIKNRRFHYYKLKYSLT